jgi:hypothetical protein
MREFRREQFCSRERWQGEELRKISNGTKKPREPWILSETMVGGLGSVRAAGITFWRTNRNGE